MVGGGDIPSRNLGAVKMERRNGETLWLKKKKSYWFFFVVL